MDKLFILVQLSDEAIAPLCRDAQIIELTRDTSSFPTLLAR
jgi:hypothetical protein